MDHPFVQSYVHISIWNSSNKLGLRRHWPSWVGCKVFTSSKDPAQQESLLVAKIISIIWVSLSHSPSWNLSDGCQSRIMDLWTTNDFNVLCFCTFNHFYLPLSSLPAGREQWKQFVIKYQNFEWIQYQLQPQTSNMSSSFPFTKYYFQT